MNIALFAADDVGYEITKFFKDNNEFLLCLVLDHLNTKKINEKILAESNANEIIYSDTLYQETVLRKFKKMNLDLIILAWWPYILKESLIRIPKSGCLNFHPSYLPFGRGKHPNFWSIVESAPFGVSLHFIDKDIDSGDIVFQKIIDMSWEDTGETLYEKSKREIINLFIDNFQQIKTGRIKRLRQDLSKGNFHYSKEIDKVSKIELDKEYKARHLLDLLRARTFPPHPAAWFEDKDEKYEVRVEIRRIDK